MADYYTLLSKAVSNLPNAAGTEPARKAIYERARKALLRQLRSLGPSLSEADIAREEAALETAIGKLEAQFGSSSPAAPGRSSGPAPAPRPGDPGRASSYVPPPRPMTPGGSGAARISMPDTPLARPASSPPPARAPLSAPPRQSAGAGPSTADRLAGAAAAASAVRSSFAAPQGAPRPALSASAAMAPLGPRPSSPASRYAPPAARRSEEAKVLPEAPRFGRASASEAAEDDYAPQVEDDDFGRSAYASNETDSLRPSAPIRIEGGRRSATPWIVVAAILGVALSVAVFAFLWRQKPADLAIKEPVATASVESSAAPAKIVERVGGAPAATPTADASAAAPGPAPSATPAASPAPIPTPTPGAAPAANAAPPAASATPAASNPPAPANPGVAVAARAAMLVAVASDPQKPAVSLGSVVWSEIPAAPGQPASVAVKAEADLPDLKMHAVMTMRKNSDPSLPASHTIELRLSFADGSTIKGVKDMRVPMMRRDDPPAQDALAGVRVKISDSYFLIGLNRGDAELAHNLDLIANRGWFDFPMLLGDDRIAKLTFEKGAEGERIVNDALAAWK